MNGFAVWAQGPQGTSALTGCALVVGMILGYLTGRKLGWRAAVAEMRQRREEARAVQQVRRWRELPADEPVLYGKRRPRDARGDPDLISKILARPPEVAHEWEPAHVGQALQVANGDPITTGEIQAITPRMDAFLQELFRVPYSADELWSGQ